MDRAEQHHLPVHEYLARWTSREISEVFVRLRMRVDQEREAEDETEAEASKSAEHVQQTPEEMRSFLRGLRQRGS